MRVIQVALWGLLFIIGCLALVIGPILVCIGAGSFSAIFLLKAIALSMLGVRMVAINLQKLRYSLSDTPVVNNTRQRVCTCRRIIDFLLIVFLVVSLVDLIYVVLLMLGGGMLIGIPISADLLSSPIIKGAISVTAVMLVMIFELLGSIKQG